MNWLTKWFKKKSATSVSESKTAESKKRPQKKVGKKVNPSPF